MKRMLSKERRKRKATAAASSEALSVVSEQSQNLQSGDENKQPSTIVTQLETKPEGEENKSEQFQNLQSEDKNKQPSAIAPQLQTKPNKKSRKRSCKKKIASNIDVATRERIVRQLREFYASSDLEYKFEDQLGKTERALIHELSWPMGLLSKSRGSGDKRRLSVYKTKKIRREIRKEIHSFLKFPEESKEVLLKLFIQYPPGQDGIEQVKISGCSEMKKKSWNKWDDTFCKPLMNRVDIAKEVGALSLRVTKDLNLAKINEQRSRLPIASYRDVILSEIENHQVVLISGETGCGKTTQVPQFLLDKMWGTGQACKIVCTQPRRISATSVAERVSQERGEVVGETVGYKIRMESKGGRRSSLLFCTNGILLKILVSDGLAGSNPGSSRAVESSRVSHITHIVVDEIHERDHNSDFILAILRDMLPRYPHLRLVLMSATMDVERFSQYFGGCPIIQVPGFTYPVKTFYLEDVLSILKSSGKNHIDSSEQRELTDEHNAALDEAIDLALLIDEFDALLESISTEGSSNVLNYQHSRTGVSPLMVFAAKGRVGDIFVLLSLGADFLLKAQDGSTALDWAKRAQQTKAADAINRHLMTVSSKSKDNQVLVDDYLSSVNPKFIDVVLIEQLLRKLCVDSKCGAILVFLPGWDDINRTRDRLLSNNFFKDPSKFWILALHSMLPSAEQKKVFNRPPRGCRKIILSTNIAETAVTIDDVVYVIDSGRLKEKSYDPYNNVSSLQSSWVSKASAKQRAGRSGRCQPGFCYHLYSKLQADCFPEFRTPEIKRMPIEELCLQVKMLDPTSDIAEFLNKTLDPPLPETIRNAVAVLKEIGALSNDEILTELGKQLGSLPVHPLTSKMLFSGILFDCLDPALTLACASYYKDPFVLPVQKRKEAADAKAQLAALYGGHSDQLAVVAAFECWKNAKATSLKYKFCSKYFLSFNTMTMLSSMRKQLQRELVSIGYIQDNISTGNYNQNAQNPGIVQAVLVAGLYPRLGRVNPPTKTAKKFYMETASGDRIRVHNQSTYALSPLIKSNDSALVVYNEIMDGDGGLQVKKCSIIWNLLLVLLAKEIAVAPTKDNSDGDVKNEDKDDSGSRSEKDDKEIEIPDEERVMSSADNPVVVIVDRWISFKSTALEIAQIYCLRERLSAAINFKAINPSKPVPPALAASVHAIACILSCDRRPRTLLASNYDDNPTSTVSVTETEKSCTDQKSTDQTPHHHLTHPNLSSQVTAAQGTDRTTHSLNQSVPLLPRQFPASQETVHGTDLSALMLLTELFVSRAAHGTVPLNQSVPSLPAQFPVSQETVHGTNPMNQSVPSLPSQVSVPQREVHGTQSSEKSVPSRPAQVSVSKRKVHKTQPLNKSGPLLPAQPKCSVPTSILSSHLPTQQPRAVQTGSVPKTLTAHGSGVYGPYGPRGAPSKKRSHSSMQQQPRTVPETLTGYGSGEYGPYGPRGRPSKKSRF